MIKYTFSAPVPSQQYLSVVTEFETEQAEETVRLASWRPGRYELGNFAKNVKGFRVFGEDGKPLPVEKITKDCWKIRSAGTTKIRIEYQYYASELNAGSTYVSKEQLYVNPVNCCLFVEGKENVPCEISLTISGSWRIACSMKQESGKLYAENYEELADSPWICSAGLQHNSYEVAGIPFHLWFQGEARIDWERLIRDFMAFTAKQLEKFTEFPVKEYHFLFHIVPYKAYHGVEHQRSTVILLGPSYDIFDAFYKELLGVSSHELYHTWNVKAIRPIEMFPYDYTKENYSRLGYLCEGVTTYQGDLFLYKSGVFTFPQYAAELTAQLQKHFDNFGRFNHSVADSSFDTWLDGYVPGAPNRKVSIYTEGCLLAFATDVFILKHSKEKYGLDDVMKSLYFNFYLQGKGVSEEDYSETIRQLAGKSMDDIFRDFFYGTQPFESLLTESFEYLGLEMVHTPSPKYSHGKLGFKTIPQGNHFVVKAIYPGSPAELAGLTLEDEIVAVNGYDCNGELDKWLAYFDDDMKTVTVLQKGRFVEITFPEVNRNFYLDYSIRKIAEPNQHQKRAFDRWSK